MKNFKVVVFLLIVLIYDVSCKKYLDKKSNNSITSPSTLEDLQGLLDDIDNMNIDVTPAMGEASCNDYFFDQNLYNQNSAFQKSLYKWQIIDYTFPNDWSKSCRPVYNANYCLDMIEKIPVTAQNRVAWENIKGSAMFFRAFNFLNLTWQYGKAYDQTTSDIDLGIPLRLTSDFNVPSIRANVKECYERVIGDASEAIHLLPNLPLNIYRPSKAAAYGLMVRAYLSTRNYQKALEYADSALALKNSLLNFATDISANSTRPFSSIASNVEIIFYTQANSSISSMRVGNIDTTLFSSYATNDLRRTAFFRARAPYQIFKGSYTGSTTLFSGIATDELFLTRAECNARLGNKDAAMVDLNALMQKRWKAGTFTPFTASDAQQALSLILTERRKELIFRGLRWIDIKRLNKEGRNIILSRNIDNQIYQLQPNVNYYALLIPIDVIQQSGIPQNIYP